MTEADFLTAIRSHWTVYGAALTTGGAAPLPAAQLWEDDEGVPDGPYHRCTVRPSAGVGVSLGRAREETRGTIQVQVFAPWVDGPGPCERLASAVADAWRRFRNPRVVLAAPSVAGLPRDGAFNRALVTVTWRGDLRPTP